MTTILALTLLAALLPAVSAFVTWAPMLRERE